MANQFSVSHYPSSGGQNPMSVGYTAPTKEEYTQGNFIPGLLSMLGNIGGNFLGTTRNALTNLSQGFTNWQNTNNPNRYTPTSDSPQKTSNDEELLPKDFLGFPERWDTLPEINTQLSWPPPPGALGMYPDNRESRLAPQREKMNREEMNSLMRLYLDSQPGPFDNMGEKLGGTY